MGNDNSRHISVPTRGHGKYSERSRVEDIQPYTVTIEGVLPIRCTIRVDNSTINILDDNHHVCILGTNNNIIVNGSGVILRIEGDDNNIKGSGGIVSVFSDSSITFELHHLKGISKANLTNEDGDIDENAPELLNLEWDDDEKGQDSERRGVGKDDEMILCISYAYTHAVDGKKDDDEEYEEEDNSGDEDEDNSSDEDEDNSNEDEDSSKDKPGNGNSRKRGTSDTDTPKSKKAKNEAPKDKRR